MGVVLVNTRCRSLMIYYRGSAEHLFSCTLLITAILTPFLYVSKAGIRRRGGRGCIHTCQLRGRVRLNTYTFACCSYNPRTKHLIWRDTTNGLADNSTDLSYICCLHILFFRSCDRFWKLLYYLIFEQLFPPTAPGNGYFTGVPLLPEYSWRGFSSHPWACL